VETSLSRSAKPMRCSLPADRFILEPDIGPLFDFVIIFEEVRVRIAFEGEYLPLLILVFRVYQLEVDSTFTDAQHRDVSSLPFDG
jgi:hypothetical protein